MKQVREGKKGILPQVASAPLHPKLQRHSCHTPPQLVSNQGWDNKYFACCRTRWVGNKQPKDKRQKKVKSKQVHRGHNRPNSKILGQFGQIWAKSDHSRVNLVQHGADLANLHLICWNQGQWTPERCNLDQIQVRKARSRPAKAEKGEEEAEIL